MRSSLRLQHRIVIPFAIVAVIAIATVATVILSLAAGALRSRLETQLVSTANLLGRTDWALNRAIIQNVHDIIGAQVVTMGADGYVVATTVDDRHRDLIESARGVVAAQRGRTGAGAGAVWMDCGAPCLIVYRPVQARPQHVVALIAEASDVETATRAVARATVLAACLSIVIMVLVGHAVVGRVTAPLQRLVQFAREVVPNDPDARAEVRPDEVGALAEAFNSMLDRLARSREALVRSEKLGLAGLFAARVAHDIRNPLSSIKMQTQLLRGRLRDARDEATVTAVLRDIDQVESVIRDLLDLARPGDLTLESSSVAEVVRDALQQLSAQFAHRKIHVSTDIADDVPPVRLDRGRFKRALLNLLVNASEAMPTGGAVHVTCRVEGSSTVMLEINDDGTGIDPDVLDRVFDPFVTTKPDGVGLGLVNVKAVVEGHGGQVRLESRRPSGTRVVVMLPVADDARTREENRRG